MTAIQFKPVRHDHKAFVAKASKRKGFVDAYGALALKYQRASQKLKAHTDQMHKQNRVT